MCCVGDSRCRRRLERRRTRVGVHGLLLRSSVVEHDAVVVVDLGLVAELDQPAEAAFGDRAGVAVVLSPAAGDDRTATARLPSVHVEFTCRGVAAPPTSADEKAGGVEPALPPPHLVSPAFVPAVLRWAVVAPSRARVRRHRRVPAPIPGDVSKCGWPATCRSVRAPRSATTGSCAPAPRQQSGGCYGTPPRCPCCWPGVVRWACR
jgi:hypothetical protein